LITFQTYSIKRTGGNEKTHTTKDPRIILLMWLKIQFLGVDSRTSVGGKNARKKRERQKALEDIKDDEVKRELSKGNTLISYFEYQPQ
jgi:hypothetical protein